MDELMKYASLILLMLLTLSACASQPPAASAPPAPKPLSILVLGGGSSHDFKRWYGDTDAAVLRELPAATVAYTEDLDTIVPQLATTDVLCIANNKPFAQAATRQAIMDFATRGKGVVLLHAGMWYSWRDWPEFNRILVGGGSRSHDQIAPFEVTVTEPAHPVMKGVPATFTVTDELYHQAIDNAGTPIRPLATAYSPARSTAYPSVFLVNLPNARIVGIALGHDGRAHDLPPYHQLLKNSILWAAGQ